MGAEGYKKDTDNVSVVNQPVDVMSIRVKQNTDVYKLLGLQVTPLHIGL